MDLDARGGAAPRSFIREREREAVDVNPAEHQREQEQRHEQIQALTHGARRNADFDDSEQAEAEAHDGVELPPRWLWIRSAAFFHGRRTSSRHNECRNPRVRRA